MMQRIREYIQNIIEEYLFKPVTLNLIADALLPSLHEKVVEYLSKGFDIHERDTLKPKVGPKEEYTVYESERPATLWFLIDLSQIRAGDLVEIRRYIRLSNSGEFLLHDHYELDGERKEPAATLSSLFAPACRLTIAQSRGLSKEIGYEVFGKYEGR